MKLWSRRSEIGDMKQVQKKIKCVLKEDKPPEC